MTGGDGRSAFLTIDLGTTRIKVAGFSPRGLLLKQLSQRNRDFSDQGMSWQSADDWWLSCTALIRGLLESPELRDREILGCAVSGRAGAAIPVDREGGVLMDPWGDSRHAGDLRLLLAENPAQSGTSASLSNYAAALLAKYLWIRRERPDVARSTAHLLYAKDFIIHRLTGVAVTDWSSGPDSASWNRELLDARDIPENILPTPALPWERAGGVQADAARATGLIEGTPVIVGAHDGVSANIGAGMIGAGDFALTLGTHCVIRTPVVQPPPGSLRFYVMPPDRHIVGANALWAGRALDWFIDHWVGDGSDRNSMFEELERQAAVVDAGAGGVQFAPWLGGQLSPRRRPEARAGFRGLGLTTGRVEMYRSILEGTAFAIADVADQVTGWTGAPARVGVTGSGILNRLWLRIIADTSGLCLHITDASSEGRGAAILCSVGIGMHPDLSSAVANLVPDGTRVDPDPDRAMVYRELRSGWHDAFNSHDP